MDEANAIIPNAHHYRRRQRNGDDHVVYPFKDRVMATITKILPDRTAAQQSRVQ